VACKTSEPDLVATDCVSHSGACCIQVGRLEIQGRIVRAWLQAALMGITTARHSRADCNQDCCQMPPITRRRAAASDAAAANELFNDAHPLFGLPQPWLEALVSKWVDRLSRQALLATSRGLCELVLAFGGCARRRVAVTVSLCDDG
jgi:hypothetical protein